MIFAEAKSMIKQFINGKNCSVITYGSAGSGKTHTFLGSSFYDNLEIDGTNLIKEASPTKKSPAKRSPLKAFNKDKRLGSNHKNEGVPGFFSPKKVKRELDHLATAPHVDLHTMRILEELAYDE